MSLRVVTLGFLLLMAGSARAADKLVVFPELNITNAEPKFDARGSAQLHDELRRIVAKLLDGSDWALAAPDAVTEALTQIGSDRENCVDMGCHIQLAQQLKAQRLLSGMVLWVDEGFTLTLSLIDVRSTSIVVTDDFGGADVAAIAAAFEQEGRSFFQRGRLLPREAPKPPPPKVVERKTRVEPRTGLEFAWFSGGAFKYGCEEKDEHCTPLEKPAKDVTAPAFWLGKTEVTEGAYERCVREAVCEPAVESTLGLDRCFWQAKPDRPVNCVTWDHARQFCQWIGGDLPTAEMWEYAAKDGEARIYPWGNDEPTHEQARFKSETATAVGQYPAGATPAGLLDMAGNLSEWTSTPSEIDGYMQIRGGAYSSEPLYLRNSARGKALPYQAEDWLGFRCMLPDAPRPAH